MVKRVRIDGCEVAVVFRGGADPGSFRQLADGPFDKISVRERDVGSEMRHLAILDDDQKVEAVADADFALIYRRR